MNWSLFLLNQFLKDALAAQNWRPFSYSFLLILITLVAWMEPEDYQLMVVEEVKVCYGARYQNLWWVEEPSQQMDSAIHFWIYWEALQLLLLPFLEFLPTSWPSINGSFGLLLDPTPFIFRPGETVIGSG